LDKELEALVAKGKTQGYLTYDEVAHYLPDQAVDPEKLDSLLIALDEQRIELLNAPPEPEFYEAGTGEQGAEGNGARHGEPGVEGRPELRLVLPDEPPAKWSSDPIRLYLSQMAEIPLLTREREIGLQEDRSRTQTLSPHGGGMQPGPAGHRRHAHQGPQRRAAVRPHREGLAHRAAHQGADPRAHAA